MDINLINDIEFERIKKDNILKTYKSKSRPNILLKLAPKLNISEEITLCKGAQVILTYNIDHDKKLVNGSRGVCLEVQDNMVLVQFRNNIIQPITYIKYIPEEDNINEYIEYMPLKLGYAITCHKSQGMTLDAIEVDLGSKIFCDGQAYTALSRAQKLENIKIINFNKKSFMTSEIVKEFYRNI
jgi:ATP-dependent exoDNAse (exonuclease V) alpha subunit